MPKKYKDKKNKKWSDELTNQERKAVEDVEKYIDDQIDIQWENGGVLIDLCIVNFDCDPDTGGPTTWTRPKKIIMNQLLFSKYRDNDWRMSEVNTEDQCRFIPTKF